MFRFLVVAAALVLQVSASSAKPLLLDSQDTYVTACLAWNDTDERLIQICRNALSDPGISDRQRIELQEVLVWSLDGDGQADKAYELATAMTKDFPQQPLGWETLAWLEYGEDNYEVAKGMFENAQSLGLRATSLAGLAATLNRLGEVDETGAVEMLDAALALDTDYQWAMREKGYILGGIGRYDEAIASFEDAMELNDQSVHNQYGLLWALSEGEYWEDALPIANEILTSYPDHFNALSRRSLIFLFLDRPKLALKDAETLLTIRPDDDDGAVRKARAMFALGQRQHAIAFLQDWVERLGRVTYVEYWIAYFLHFDGRSRAAMPYIEQVVSDEPDDYFYRKLRGFIALDLADIETAEADAKRARALRPSSQWALQLQALVQLAQGEFDLAFETIAQADEAGLPRDEFSFFVSELVEGGHYIKAIKLRALYPE